MAKKKDCSWCFYCEPKGDFFFCGYHSLEVYNPRNAGCRHNTKGKLIISKKQLINRETYYEKDTRTHRTI
jgi:hypothetical protein